MATGVLMTPKEVAVAAADYIHEHGWVKGVLKTEDGRVCLAGGIMAVLGMLDGSPEQANPDYRIDPVFEVYYAVIKSAEAKIGRSVITWNDFHANNQEEVEELLRSLEFEGVS